MKLNDRTVTTTNPALPAGKSDFTFFDEDIKGLGLRVRGSGVRSWVFQYWHGGKARKMTLGKWPKVSAQGARALIEPLAAKVALGGDPASEKIEARAPKESFADIVEAYLAAQSKRLRPRSYSEVERHLNSHAKPLHALSVESLTRRHVADLLTSIATERGPVAANRVRSSIVAALAWAMKAGKATENPAAFTNKEKEKPRSRALSPRELREVWNALPDDGNYSAIVRLLILTGQRKGEIGDLRWSEIDLKKKAIILPAERVKNDRPHVVPLSPPALAIIKTQKKIEGRDFVFGEGEGGFSGWSRCKERLDAKLGKMPEWTIHDLRRSAATGMNEIGVPPHIVEAILNHMSGSKGGIAGVYNHASYEAEKRNGLNRWARHILRRPARKRAA